MISVYSVPCSSHHSFLFPFFLAIKTFFSKSVFLGTRKSPFSWMTVNALTSRLLLAWLLFLKDCDLFELTSLSSVFWSDVLYLPGSLCCPFAQSIPCVVFWALLSQLLLGGDPLPHKSLPTLYKCEKAASCVTNWSLGHTVFIENLFNVSGMCY